MLGRFLFVVVVWFIGVATHAAAQAGAERAQLIPAICAALQSEYTYPDVAQKMADALRAHEQRGDYAAITDPTALATRITADLREVSHDGHLGAKYHPEGARTDPEDWTLADLDRMRERAQRENFNFRKVEHMDGNVGYLDVRSFYDPYLAADAASAAMRFLAHTDALIVDLRENHGGEPTGVAFLLSFLFDTRTHLNDILVRRGDRLDQYWTSQMPGPIFGGQKPVYVLTSKGTFSGAEDFAYALQNLKRAVIVGETTGGGAHPTRQFRVTKHFAMWIPFARSVSPVTHKDWEGTGVSPDVAVPAADALRTAYRAALQQLVASAKDPEHKRDLQQLLAATTKN